SYAALGSLHNNGKNKAEAGAGVGFGVFRSRVAKRWNVLEPPPRDHRCEEFPPRYRVALDHSPPPLRQPMHMGAANAVGGTTNLHRPASIALTRVSTQGTTAPHISVGTTPLLFRQPREQGTARQA